MKRIINIVASVVLLFGVSTVAQAQEVDYTQGYNYVEVQGGAQATLTHFNFSDLITPQYAVSFGRYFNDKVGARLHVQGYQINSGFKADRYPFIYFDRKYKFNDITTDLDLLLNLSNIINPNRDNHTWNWYGVLGFGVNYTWGTDEFNKIINTYECTDKFYNGPVQCADKHASFNGRLGTGVEVNVSKNFAISLEADANYKNDQFNYKFNDKCDWQIAAFVGVKYKFGVKTKKVVAPEPIVEPIVEEPAPAPAPAPVVVEKKPEPAPVVKKEEPLKETIFYAIRSSETDVEAIIKKVVDWCNEYPAKQVSVQGYADKGTGNAKLNVGYAKARAQKVADAIIAAGVAKSRVQVESFGDTVQPFAENDKNRCVIIIGE